MHPFNQTNPENRQKALSVSPEDLQAVNTRRFVRFAAQHAVEQQIVKYDADLRAQQAVSGVALNQTNWEVTQDA